MNTDVRKEAAAPTPQASAETKQAEGPTEKPDRHKAQEALALLLERAEQGDLSVLPKLRETLDADPLIWKNYGDVGLHAEAMLIKLAAGKNLVMGESLQRRGAALRAELAGESPTPLERLLAARVALTYLQVNYYAGLSARAVGADAATVKMIQGQQDAADRRHLAAVKMLATIRKLAAPALSPVEISRRMDKSGAGVNRCREGIAGTVGVLN